MRGKDKEGIGGGRQKKEKTEKRQNQKNKQMKILP